MYFMKKRWHMFLIMLVFTSPVVDADDSAIEISVKSDELKKMLQDIKESGEPMSISELAPPKIPDSGKCRASAGEGICFGGEAGNDK